MQLNRNQELLDQIVLALNPLFWMGAPTRLFHECGKGSKLCPSASSLAVKLTMPKRNHPTTSDSTARPINSNKGAGPQTKVGRSLNLHAAWVCRGVATCDTAQQGVSAFAPAAASSRAIRSKSRPGMYTTSVASSGNGPPHIGERSLSAA
jgi:hypothetical protein